MKGKKKEMEMEILASLTTDYGTGLVL